MSPRTHLADYISGCSAADEETRFAADLVRQYRGCISPGVDSWYFENYITHDELADLLDTLLSRDSKNEYEVPVHEIKRPLAQVVERPLEEGESLLTKIKRYVRYAWNKYGMPKAFSIKHITCEPTVVKAELFFNNALHFSIRIDQFETKDQVNAEIMGVTSQLKRWIKDHPESTQARAVRSTR